MQPLLDQITNNTASFNVVAQAPSGEALTTVDAAAASGALKTLLEAAVASVYTLQAPEGTTPTDAIYRLVAATPVELQGVRILTQVTFVVTLRALDYDALIAALSAVETQLQNSSDPISITDAVFDFDDNVAHYLADIELQYMVPAVTGTPSFPAALVELDSVDAQPSQYDNTVRQRADNRYAITLISDSNNLQALRTELQGALLGWQETNTHFDMQYQNGVAISLPGGLYAWRETYTDGLIISQ